MIEKYTYLHVYSELNTWIDFVITLSQSEDGDRAKQIAEQAYENWFKTTNEQGQETQQSLDISKENQKKKISNVVFSTMMKSKTNSNKNKTYHRNIEGAIGKWTVLNKVSYVGFVRMTCIDSLIFLCYHKIN